MMQYIMTVELESPLMISSTRGTGHLLKGTDHIPGTVCRGAVSELFSDNEFQRGKLGYRIFVNGEVSFSPLYPSPIHTLSIPVPLSAFSCKFTPGFTVSQDMGHGVHDFLLQSNFLDECSKCDAPLTPFSGYYFSASGYHMLAPVIMKRVAHTAVSIWRRVADEGSLYTYEVLDTHLKLGELQPQTFSGTLLSNDDGLMKALSKKIESHGSRLLMGKGTTRGYGKVRIREFSEIGLGEDLSTRLEGLNKKANDISGQAKGCYFSLTLQTDTIILDPYLNYCTYIDPEDISSATGNNVFEKFRLVRSFCTSTRIRGWNRMIGLPKQDEIAITKGSCFLFSAEDGSDNLLHELESLLKALEKNGIGERRSEGFGRLRVSDPIHWQEEVL